MTGSFHFVARGPKPRYGESGITESISSMPFCVSGSERRARVVRGACFDQDHRAGAVLAAPHLAVDALAVELACPLGLGLEQLLGELRLGKGVVVAADEGHELSHARSLRDGAPVNSV